MNLGLILAKSLSDFADPATIKWLPESAAPLALMPAEH